ncbi:hypothetical protein IAD21_03166 [Abditibacteriota bacterium]|nr:hypothetical protein IAD21_03166 [Abditibacteriota bacterium]
MSLLLRERWLKQLEAAQTDPSWQGQVEARVLRFLLARYEGKGEDALLAPFPLYEGQSPYGRTHLPLTGRQIGERLRHIAKIDAERPHESSSFWDAIAYRDVERHKREEARRERFRTRKERGYW